MFIKSKLICDYFANFTDLVLLGSHSNCCRFLMHFNKMLWYRLPLGHLFVIISSFLLKFSLLHSGLARLKLFLGYNVEKRSPVLFCSEFLLLLFFSDMKVQSRDSFLATLIWMNFRCFTTRRAWLGQLAWRSLLPVSPLTSIWTQVSQSVQWLSIFLRIETPPSILQVIESTSWTGITKAALGWCWTMKPTSWTWRRPTVQPCWLIQ